MNRGRVRASSRTDADLAEITPEGALAGRTFSIVLIGSAFGLVAASWDELWRSCGEVVGLCVERTAGAVLLTILAVFAFIAGIGIWRRVGRRVVDPDGSSRYIWALGLLFAVGLALIAARIPAFSCDRGRFDELLELCMHPPTTSAATNWLLMKKAIVIVGLLGGATIAARPSGVRLSAPAAVLAWAGGAGWTVVDTMVLDGG
jgi:hypothetical protein